MRELWGNEPRSFCDECLSPLEVSYDMEALATALPARILKPDNEQLRCARFNILAGKAVASGLHVIGDF